MCSLYMPHNAYVRQRTDATTHSARRADEAHGVEKTPAATARGGAFLQPWGDARKLCGVGKAGTLLDCAYVRWQTDRQDRSA
jgi:hypothetical protein